MNEARVDDGALLAAAVEREHRVLFFYRTVLGSGKLAPASVEIAAGLVADHEAHRAFIASLEGVPRRDPLASYPLPPSLSTDGGILRAATDLEEEAAQALYGSLARLALPPLRLALASVLAVEAQHVAVLRAAQRLEPVPHPFLSDGLS